MFSYEILCYCLHFVALGGIKAVYATNANGICWLIELGVVNKFYFYNYVASTYLDFVNTWSAILGLSSVFDIFLRADVPHAALPLCTSLTRVRTSLLLRVCLLLCLRWGVTTVNFYISQVPFFSFTTILQLNWHKNKNKSKWQSIALICVNFYYCRFSFRFLFFAFCEACTFSWCA